MQRPTWNAQGLESKQRQAILSVGPERRSSAVQTVAGGNEDNRSFHSLRGALRHCLLSRLVLSRLVLSRLGFMCPGMLCVE
jgi:hypothetical protein